MLFSSSNIGGEGHAYLNFITKELQASLPLFHLIKSANLHGKPISYLSKMLKDILSQIAMSVMF